MSNNSPDRSKLSVLGKRDGQGNLVLSSAQKEDTENLKKDDDDGDGQSDKSKGDDDNSEDSNEASKRAPAIRGIGVSRIRRSKAAAQNAVITESSQAQRKEPSTAPKKIKKKPISTNKIVGLT